MGKTEETSRMADESSNPYNYRAITTEDSIFLPHWSLSEPYAHREKTKTNKNSKPIFPNVKLI